MTITRVFITSDGYRLYPVGGWWQDSVHDVYVDMTFAAGPDGLPVDSGGTPLEGRLVVLPEAAATKE